MLTPALLADKLRFRSHLNDARMDSGEERFCLVKPKGKRATGLARFLLEPQHTPLVTTSTPKRTVIKIYVSLQGLPCVIRSLILAMAPLGANL